MMKKAFLIIAVPLIIMTGAMSQTGGLIVACPNQSEQPKEEKLTVVEAKYVCMINNQHFDKEQIRVEVEGRVYYGCCEMCEKKLREEPESRVAVDPVSGNQVDKAAAVIGADSEGKIFYFENEKNLRKFRRNSK